jgi:hypothetical protein
MLWRVKIERKLFYSKGGCPTLGKSKRKEYKKLKKITKEEPKRHKEEHN